MQRQDTKRNGRGDESIDAKNRGQSRRQVSESTRPRKTRSLISAIPSSFFNQPTAKVAKALLGHDVHRFIDGKHFHARIVETEAYLGTGDPASHGAKRTPRSSVMFGPPGNIYVYFIYGNYFMLNFVTEPEETAGAVLIRAIEPISGFSESCKTNGPAKLALALAIDRSLNGLELSLPHLAVANPTRPVLPRQIVTTTRIGISSGKELPLRFYERDNSFVSKK